MEFWNGSSHIGTIGTKGNPFPGVDKNGNPVVSDGNSLLLVADNPQKLLVCLTNQAQDI